MLFEGFMFVMLACCAQPKRLMLEFKIQLSALEHWFHLIYHTVPDYVLQFCPGHVLRSYPRFVNPTWPPFLHQIIMLQIEPLSYLLTLPETYTFLLTWPQKGPDAVLQSKPLLNTGCTLLLQLALERKCLLYQLVVPLSHFQRNSVTGT